jgi:hypothetical protein
LGDFKVFFVGFSKAQTPNMVERVNLNFFQKSHDLVRQSRVVLGFEQSLLED